MSGDLTLINTKVWTGVPGHSGQNEIRVRDGRVVGPDTPDQPGRGHARVIDTPGAMVIPGLIDAHLHLLMGGRGLTEVDLSDVDSREAFHARIAAAHERLGADEWLVAHGWSESNWGGVAPTHDWLATASDRPTVCYRTDIHAAVVNDVVLGMIPTDSDPPGGRIVRDSAGHPTGLLQEAAVWELVNPLIPRPSIARRREILLDAQSLCHRMGLTTVGTMEYFSDVEHVYTPMRDRLTLRCIATILDRAWPMSFDAGRDFANDDRLRVIGYKAFIDGTLGSRTARLINDYTDDPGNRGILVELAHDGHLLTWAQAVASAGLSPSMHAIGDEAVRLALDVIHALPPGAHARLEHAQQIAPEDVARLDGVTLSMQPEHKTDDARIAAARLGDDRLDGFFAFRSMMDAGGHLAFGSDWPVVTLDPMAGIRAAVTGLDRDGRPCRTDQNLTVEEALIAYTSGAARCLCLDDVGPLTPGAVGDLVVLDRDPFAIDWSVEVPQVLMTVASGEVVYERDA